ncbi:MAG: hypothetical protein ACO1RX_11430 [Candidatus Sericytochromatia bacterium]
MEISPFSPLAQAPSAGPPSPVAAAPSQPKAVQSQAPWPNDQAQIATAKAASLTSLAFTEAEPLRARELVQVRSQLEREISSPGEWRRAADKAYQQGDTLRLNALMGLAAKQPAFQVPGWLHYREAAQRATALSGLPLASAPRPPAAQLQRLVAQGLESAGLAPSEQRHLLDNAAISARYLEDAALLLDLGQYASARGLPNGAHLQQEALHLARQQAQPEVLLNMLAKLPPQSAEATLLAQSAQVALQQRQDVTGLRLLAQLRPHDSSVFQQAVTAARTSRSGFDLAALALQAKPGVAQRQLFQDAVNQARQSRDPALLLTLLDAQLDQGLDAQHSGYAPERLFREAVDLAKSRQDADLLVQLLERQTRSTPPLDAGHSSYTPDKLLQTAVNTARTQNPKALQALVSLQVGRGLDAKHSSYTPERLYREALDSLRSKPDTPALLDWISLAQAAPELYAGQSNYTPAKLLERALNEARSQRSPELFAQMADLQRTHSISAASNLTPERLLNEAAPLSSGRPQALVEVATSALACDPPPQGASSPAQLLPALARAAQDSPELQLQLIALSGELSSPSPVLQPRLLTRQLLQNTGLL